MSEVCGQCVSKFKQNEISLKCSGFCDNIFHPKCVNLQSKDIQFLNNNAENIKWFCDKCKIFFKNSGEITKQWDSFKNEVIKQLNEFKSILNINQMDKATTNIKKSYSEVAGEVIVIKPKTAQDNQVTKNDIQKNIKPAVLEVGIQEIKNTKEGGILIKCNNKNELEKIKAVAEKKLNKNYKINIPEQKNPCIKIVDLEENMEENILKDNILKQNSFLNKDKANLQIKVVKKMKSRYMAIVECDPDSFMQIMECGKLNIGWTVCRVFEYVRVYRCFKCGSFDHKIDECKKEKMCLKCCKNDHSTEDCDGELVRCGNCIETNNKLNLNLSVDHSMFDTCCTVFKRKIDAEKRKIKIASDNQ